MLAAWTGRGTVGFVAIGYSKGSRLWLGMVSCAHKASGGRTHLQLESGADAINVDAGRVLRLVLVAVYIDSHPMTSLMATMRNEAMLGLIRCETIQRAALTCSMDTASDSSSRRPLTLPDRCITICWAPGGPLPAGPPVPCSHGQIWPTWEAPRTRQAWLAHPCLRSSQPAHSGHIEQPVCCSKSSAGAKHALVSGGQRPLPGGPWGLCVLYAGSCMHLRAG